MQPYNEHLAATIVLTIEHPAAIKLLTNEYPAAIKLLTNEYPAAIKPGLRIRIRNYHSGSGSDQYEN